MAKKTIKPGYQILIKTWENDGDCYKTQSIDGLTEEQVKFYVFFCSFFDDSNTHRRDDKYNLSSNEENYLPGLVAMVSEGLHLYPEARAMFEQDMPLPPVPTEEEFDLFDMYCDLPWNDPRRAEYDRGNFNAAQWSDFVSETIVEVLGHTENYYDEPYFARPVESITVYYHPGEVQDVTKQFINED